MPLSQVVVLAVVQGLTEFLPVSSTAHLYLSSWLLGWQTESLGFDISLHIGTLIAVLIYFLPDWIQILGQGFGMRIGGDEDLKLNSMLLWLLVIGTIPAGIAGLLLNKYAESTWRNPFLMGTMLVVVGIVMWIADRGERHTRHLASVNISDSLAIGFGQALAVVPGVSRSGITISAALFRGLTRAAAARFSFLLSTPTIAGAAAKDIYDIYKESGVHGLLNTNFLTGIAVSAVTGWIVIAWFLHYLRRSSLMPFVYYRIVFGIIVLALAFIRRPA
ncbi:MAG: undecaprenyl-diphosphate phosphatase [Acidobacteriia bacterium]|nr:undecaprenyl-diphosphate phosphatase [Terriglobia bacterium]